MTERSPELDRRIAGIASNRDSGASELLVEVLAILSEAIERGHPINPVAHALVRAQPTMAPVWNACLIATAYGDRAAPRLAQFAERARRAPSAIARFAVECLAPTRGDARTPVATAEPPLRLVTISFSGSVAAVLDVLRARRALRLSCSEGRPALEGRRLASIAAGMSIPVTFFSDAAIGHALAAADAVIVGADAVGPEWFLNKSGTRMLAAAAAQLGVPLYVLASRDKFVSHALGARLSGREGEPAEIWEDPTPGVTVRNPYFESIPLDLVTAVISDAGVLGAGMVPDACQAAQDAAMLEALRGL